MDAETINMVRNIAIFLKRLKSNVATTKTEKYDLITKRIIILDGVLKAFMNRDLLCCRRPGPKDDCALLTVEITMSQALEELIEYVPTSSTEIINSQYLELTTALERMHRDARYSMMRFPHCSMTDYQMIKWGEFIGRVQMLIFSRYAYSQNSGWTPRNILGLKDRMDEKYHEEIWKKMGHRGYILPIVKYLDGIDLFVEKNALFIQEVLDGKVHFSCSNCQVYVHSENDCAILDTCEHLVCIKCAYTMAVKKDVNCRMCNESTTNWTTKSVIKLSKCNHTLAKERSDMLMNNYGKIGFFFVAGCTFVAGLYNYLAGSK